MDAADWQCADCLSKTETLEVHHRHYSLDRYPWEYDVSELSVLCSKCHRKRHGTTPELTPQLDAQIARGKARLQAARELVERSRVLAGQRSGEAKPTRLEAEIARLKERISAAEIAGDLTGVRESALQAIELTRRRLGMVN
jgi:hypothetical protein